MKNQRKNLRRKKRIKKMINHSALEERLTAITKIEQVPEPPLPPASKNEVHPQPQQSQAFITYKQFFINEGYKTFNVLATSMLYGFGVRAIFAKDWNFIGLLGAGFLLNHFLTLSLKLFKRK